MINPTAPYTASRFADNVQSESSLATLSLPPSLSCFQPFELVKEIQTNPSPRFLTLKSLVPPQIPEQHQTQFIREVSKYLALSEMESVPKRPQKMPSTVEIAACSWKSNISQNLREINVIGFRHGTYRINKNTVSHLKSCLKDVNPKLLFCEYNLGSFLKKGGLPVPKEMQDYKIMKSYAAVDRFALAIIMIIKPFEYCARLARMAFLSICGPLKRPDIFPAFELQHRSAGFMPESAEIEAHQLLPVAQAKALDESDVGQLIPGRSAYMAGYLAAVAEQTTEEGPITVLVGGLHIPRIKSLLHFESRDQMPISLQAQFDKGYNS